MIPRLGRPVRWLPLPVLLAAAVAWAAAPAPEQDLLLPVHPDDLLILEVHAERYLASRGLIGYHCDGKVLLPLGELAAVLEYAIHADPRRGVAEGWLGEEGRTFRLDIAERSVSVAGQQQGLSGACLYLDDADIYVTSEMLQLWWPLELEIDLRGLRVIVRANEVLPLVSRLQREADWSRHLGREEKTVQYPHRRAAYRLASWPFLDATVAFSADRRQEVWRGSLLSRGDLARLSVTGFLNYQQRSANEWTAWLRAGRTDREARLLGPLAATSVEFGDVTSDALALIGSSGRGRGVSLTNRPLGSLSQFDAVDVHGDAPPGWDVELYLNGSLHAIQAVEDDGRFLFAAVPLRLGLNVVRTVQYGPSGQIRENVQTYNIRSGMWPQGKLYYNYSSLQLGESILGSSSLAVSDSSHGRWSHQLDLGYGLSPLTTIGLAAVRTHDGNTPRDYLQARLLQSFKGIFLQAVAVKESAGGLAGNISSQALWGRQSLYLSYAQFDDFGSRSVEGDGLMRRRVEARLTGAVRPQSDQPLNYRLSWHRDHLSGEDDLVRQNLSLNLNTLVRRMSLGHDLTYYEESGVDRQDLWLGRWLLAGYLRGIRVRGEIDYDLQGRDGVRSLAAGANYAFHPNLTGQFTVRRNLLDDGSTSLLSSFDWHQRWVRLGLRLGYNDPGGASVGLAATTSLAKAPAGSGLRLSGQRLAQYGAAMATVFIDHDADGVCGPGDEPLAGIGFKRHQLWRDIRTDAEGRAFLPGIQANQFINVLVDLASIDDPFLVPVYEGMTTVVHPGGVVNLAFPFQYVGEIEGLVVLDPQQQRPLRNIGLELLDATGERVGEAVSEFDGNYLIQDVLPGQYRLRVVESTLRGRPFLLPAPQPVVIPPGGDYVRGPTIVLTEGAPQSLAVAELSLQPADEPVPAATLAQAPARPQPVLAPSPTPSPTPSPASGPEATAPAATVPATPPPPAAAPADEAVAAQTVVTQPIAPSDAAPHGEATQAARPAVPPAATTPARPPVGAEREPAGLSPATVRTLHLIYELLHESTLFDRN